MWIAYVFGAFLVVVIIILFFYTRSLIINKNTNNKFEQTLIAEGFKVDKKIIYKDLAFFVDSENKNWCAKENNESSIRIYRFSDLIKFTVSENNKEVESKGTGINNLAGILLFGNEDMSAGKEYKKCNKMQISIKVRNSEYPMLKLHLIKGVTTTMQGSPEYKKAVNAVEWIVAALSDIQKMQLQ